VLYSSALRRLAQVTQVVSAGVGHVFHNRLTHSLQVAQVGRRLAERLRAPSSPATDPPEPDVVEAACLVHDLGHPPFGHIAEDELNELGKEFGGFEGNAQSFRIVTKLSQHSPNHRGLDLTRATLAAVLKYPWLRGENSEKRHKWGAYFTELKDFKFATELCPAAKICTVEAKLMDWADDITYSVHDLDDFYRAGLIPLHLLADKRSDRERRAFFEAVYARHPERQGIWADHRELEEAFNELVIGLFPLDRAYTGEWKERALLRDFSSQLIGRYIGATAISEDGDMRLQIDKDRELEVTMLEELTWVYVIQAPSLISQQAGQRHVIRTLFSLYSNAALSKAKLHLFPPFYRQAIEDSPDEEHKLRVVVDLIAGMTEAQALAMHNRLTGVSVGSGLEPILS